MPEFLEGFEQALNEFLGFTGSLGSPGMLGGELAAFDQSAQQIGLPSILETIDLAGKLAPIRDGISEIIDVEQSLIDAGALHADPLDLVTKSDLEHFHAERGYPELAR